jgi:hypothetical protein
MGRKSQGRQSEASGRLESSQAGKVQNLESAKSLNMIYVIMFLVRWLPLARGWFGSSIPEVAIYELKQPFLGCLNISIIEGFYRHAGFINMSRISLVLLEFPKILSAPG